MDNRINFTSRSNRYFAITKVGRSRDIPYTAYNQLDINCERLGKFARKNNIMITFRDGRNMLNKIGLENDKLFWSGKLVMEVEKTYISF